MKKNTKKYGLVSLRKDFPTDEACLTFIFESLHSKECSCGGTYRLISGRRQFQCSKCRFQIAPTAGTIFHKSATPLTIWFQAILLFANAKSGLSAKQLQRDLEVTYKTAWRMLSLIRKALGKSGDKLKGDVEMDSAYFGGKKDARRTNHGTSWSVDKSVVIGAIERGGEARAQVVPKNSAEAHKSFLDTNIEKGSRLLTDNSGVYRNTTEAYHRQAVQHNKGVYVFGDVHVNNVEQFWSHVKRSIKGTHKKVSKKYLQNYLDGFVFHYNNRHSDKERFQVLLGTLLLGAR